MGEVGRPTLPIVADWNTTPELLAKSAILHGHNAKIIAPENCAATCSMGTGRVLDFVVASAHMAQLLTVRVDLDAPTRPHVGLDVSIDLEPLEDSMRVLKAPPIPVVMPFSQMHPPRKSGIHG